ncbi:MAG: hypothetical protein E4H13_13445, partial [Calditrichales bacterium]
MFSRFLLLGIIIIANSQAYAQKNLTYYPWQIDTLFIAVSPVSHFDFPENHRVVEQSIHLRINQRYLEPMSEFRFQQEENQVQIFAPSQAGDTLRISYQILPVLLSREYTFFQFDTLSSAADSTDTLSVLTPVFVNPFTEVGGNLKRSGSIVRGVNIGSNKDMTLNSGLNLQLSGNLTEDLEIVAALTDASTPIQPEGNTQTMREIDQVFIKFKSPWVRGVLGDFNLSYAGSQFASFSRKLQGVSLTGNYEGFELGGSIASTRGFFNFMNLIGQEGNQGPYQLLGKNGERDIIVLAGTERIWINGEKLVRGENNDYIIEYGNGQIIFTTRQLITSESRIEVDFEYYPAAQKYTRNVYSGLSVGRALNNDLNFRISYYHESDDPEKILESEQILSEEEKQIIKDAGDDPMAAAVSGATYVGENLGYYVKIDTVLNASGYSYYKYKGKLLGDYMVSFSAVGPQRGDYRREGLGYYQWVGIGRGDFLPIELLPLPNKQELVDIQVNYRLQEKLSINAEAAVSQLDKNTLSEIADTDNQGNAFNVTADLEQTAIAIGETNLGTIGVSVDGKYIDKKFQPIDRLNQPDFTKYWNLLPETEKTNQEQSVELKSIYLPWTWMTLKGGIGTFRRQNFNSMRYFGDAGWDQIDWFRGIFRYELIKSNQDQTRNDWQRVKSDINKDIGIIQPAVLLEREERKNIASDNLISGFSFLDLG